MVDAPVVEEKPGELDVRDEDTEPQRTKGLFELPDEEFLTKVKGWLKEAGEHKGEISKRRVSCRKMFEGDQWEEADRKLAEEQKRPALTFNLLQSIVHAVAGEEQDERQDIKYFGVGMEDDAGAHAWTKLLKNVMQQNNGDFAVSTGFTESLKVGEGWLVPDINYFDDPDGKYELEFVSEKEMFPDPLDTTPTADKGRFHIRAKMMNEDEAIAFWGEDKFAEVKKSAIAAGKISESDGKGVKDIYLASDGEFKMKLYDASKGQWMVFEIWWCEYQPGKVARGPMGIMEEFTDEELAEMSAEIEQQQLATIQLMMTSPGMQLPMPQMPEVEERTIKCMYQGFWCDDVVLERQKSPLKYLKRSPYVPIRGIWREEKGDWQGIVEPIEDVQKQGNIEQSVIVQLLQLMPKQSWYGPRGSFHNKNDWAAKLATPGQMLEYNKQRGEPKPVPVQAIPRHVIDMAFSRGQAMREVSGVNTEMTGQRQGDDAGVVMEMRKKAARKVLAPNFQNLRQSKIVLARVMLSYMQTYMSPERKARVLGQDMKPELIEITEDMKLGRYDLAIDETQASINDRMMTFTILQTTLPMMMKAGVPLVPEFVDLLPMDPEIRDKWKRQISWEMTMAGRLPPEGWEPGMPVPPPSGGMPPDPNMQ